MQNLPSSPSIAPSDERSPYREGSARARGRSFEELAREWSAQSKDFISLLADLLSQKVKAAMPVLIGGGIFGALGVVFGLFAIGWLSTAGYEAILDEGFAPFEAASFMAGAFVALAAVAGVGLRIQLLRHQRRKQENGAELTEAGKELLTLSKDVAKSTLAPKALIGEQAGKIVLSGIILGALLGFATQAPPPSSKLRH